jgi:hypothetical protein
VAARHDTNSADDPQTSDDPLRNHRALPSDRLPAFHRIKTKRKDKTTMKNLIAVLAVAAFVGTGLYLSKHARPIDWNASSFAANYVHMGQPMFGSNGDPSGWPVEAIKAIDAKMPLKTDRAIKFDYPVQVAGCNFVELVKPAH